ncbi:MAG: Fe-S cluster assembly protein SufB [Verrucomicrobiota bacterium]|nr:MAG: Fe-S cluster assembly protein SufB [Verrucomicrobiota bacterium]
MKDENHDFHYEVDYIHNAGTGLNEDTIRYISQAKNEPQWLLDFRLNALRVFQKLPMPTWIPPIDFDNIQYYLSPQKQTQRSWEDVPEKVKNTFERLGIPERERKFLAGVEAQFDSETAYARLQEFLTKDGIIFVDSNTGLQQYSDIFRPYFASLVPVDDNKFSALNSAVFSGGSFIYVPPGVKLKQPLQAYFRINAQRFGQFERTLIIVDHDAELLYMEGCTAPTFESAALHSAVVEVIALPGAKVQYITVQNWSSNVFNLVTKRSTAHANAEIRWIDCNIGSRITAKYPAILLAGERARGEILSIALATDNQVQDTGAKMIHRANNTTSNIVSKSVSKHHGLATYRGLVDIAPNFQGCRNRTRCDALLIDTDSRSDTYPRMTITGDQNQVEHEASVSKVDEERLLYLRQRGLDEHQATSLCVNGFVNDLIREFPLEYSVELHRLIDLVV